ncbi:MAG: SDR family oxidoreductase [Oligoflexales bacterium]|nr:SDR family oxidoreductase [Oligoflexales bacterium]
MAETILITGAFGFAGGRISRYLSENSDYYLILTSKRRDMQKPSWLGRGEVAYFDLTDFDFNIFDKYEKIDHVIHLAACSEIDCGRDPRLALQVNTLAAQDFIEKAIRKNVRRFIYFSTAHVYRTPLSGTISEDTVPRPVNPYAYTHRMTEDLVLSAHDRGLFCGAVFRLSNSFGAPVSTDIGRWNLFFNDHCRQIATTGRMTLKSSGRQRRDFICLTDVCRAVAHFLTLKADRVGDGLFNVGGGYSPRIVEVTELIAGRCKKILGFMPEIILKEQGDSSNSSEETDFYLDYRIDKLLSTGFALTGLVEKEIDDLLLFCMNHFGKK